ncbi:MAG: TerC/Alx family metal homeostasis membrane protein [Holophagaceae bacterium]
MDILFSLTQYASPTVWIVFHLFLFGMLALDLGIFTRTAHVPTFKEALGWSVLWVALSLLFNLFVWKNYGGDYGLEFLTAYLLEKSLSIDNIFVFALIFTAFNVHMRDRHRVLFWGVVGALIMRAAMIIGGMSLLNRFHWLLYIFGGFLIFTGVKMLLKKEGEKGPNFEKISQWLSSVLPYDPEGGHKNFTVLKNGKRFFTPLLLVIATIEFCDLVFAIDSIPAVLAISKNPFVVYTSNIFALLGLRALYFLIADSMARFHFLGRGLAIILVWIGIKVLSADFIKGTLGVSNKVLTLTSLSMIIGVLVLSILLSLRKPLSSKS